MQGKQRSWQSVVAVMMVGVGLMAAAVPPVARAGSGNPNPRVLPLHANAYGNSYGEWSARWWQWVLSIAEATNPNLDTTGADCAEGQSGKVWFLAGTFGDSVTRACTVPAGRALFFPILNTVFGAGVFDCEPTKPGVPCDVQTLRADAEAALDDPTTLAVSVDGTPLQRLSDYRVQSPVFSLTFPEDAVFGLPSGTFTPHISDGYWLLLAPLSAGAHTLHIKGVGADGFTTEVTYHLTVGR